jgi:hypothetical protein
LSAFVAIDLFRQLAFFPKCGRVRPKATETSSSPPFRHSGRIAFFFFYRRSACDGNIVGITDGWF